MIDWQRIQTPAADGEVLVEPPFERWRELVVNAPRSLTLAGRPIAEVRASLRRRLNLPGDGTPIISCGHQPAYIHPGVWVKRVAVQRRAERLSWAGLDLVVDNDVPHANGLDLPVVDGDGLVGAHHLQLGEGPAGSAYEGRPAVEPEAVHAARAALAPARSWLRPGSLMDVYLDAASRSPAGDFTSQHLAGCDAVDAELGCDVKRVRVSEAFGGPFVADLLLNAEPFAATYNAALAGYRRDFRVRTAQRPLPDLGRDGDWVEACLWIYVPRDTRQRLWVRARGDRLELRAGSAVVGALSVTELRNDADAAIASLRPWVLRPRALSLTLWARLLVCDFFVHGIGGAKYDRITDVILREHYRCPPPPYACVSATLRLPIDVPAVTKADLREARRQQRDFQFNPQRYLPAIPPAELARRLELVDASDRLRRARGDRFERHRIFLALREWNARLVAGGGKTAVRLAEQVDTTARLWASSQLAAGREYFYALYPRWKLAALAEGLFSDKQG